MSAELALPDPADLASLSRDELVDLGRRVVSFGPWALGDLGAAVETGYGEADLAKYADEIGVDYATLKDYRRVSAAYPAEKVDRSTYLWTVYRVLAGQKDCLDLIQREEPWTVAEARELVRSRQEPRLLPPANKPAASAAPVAAQQAGPPTASAEPPQAADSAHAEPEAASEPGQVQDVLAATEQQLAAGNAEKPPHEHEFTECIWVCRCGEEAPGGVRPQEAQIGPDQGDPHTDPQDSSPAPDETQVQQEVPAEPELRRECEVNADDGPCGKPARWYWVREAAHHTPKRRAVCPGHLEAVRKRFIVEETFVQVQALGGYATIPAEQDDPPAQSAAEVDELYEVGT